MLLKAVLISLAFVPIIFCFGTMFVIHSEFHVGAGAKWLIIWLLGVVELSDYEHAYPIVLFLVGVVCAGAIIVDLVVMYHLMVCTIVSLRVVQQILKGLIR